VDASELASPGRTVSGVQRKLLVYRDEAAAAYRPARATGPAPFIAKLNSDKREDLVRNELLSLRLAGSLLGTKEVTAFQPGYVAELNETALIVTRFDRTEDGRKLRVEDFAQILCKPRGADYGGKYDASYEDVAAVVRAHSARPEIDVARFFRRLVAFALVANGDAHLKNFSLLEQPEGLRLSPIYDVVNVAMLAGLSQQFGLRLGGKVLQLDAVTRTVLEAFGDSIGLPKAAVARTFRDLTTRARQAQKAILKAGDDERDPFSARYAEIVRNQCLKLLEP
jgi:serine/threonine-protein kinase HipA